MSTPSTADTPPASARNASPVIAEALAADRADAALADPSDVFTLHYDMVGGAVAGMITSPARAAPCAAATASSTLSAAATTPTAGRAGGRRPRRPAPARRSVRAKCRRGPESPIHWSLLAVAGVAAGRARSMLPPAGTSRWSAPAAAQVERI